MMLFFVNEIVKIDRGGPESRVGKLLAVEKDYITLLTKEDGIIYYNRHHIKSLTHNAKNLVQLDMELEDFEFIQAKDFASVLECLRYRWVKINRGGPEMLEGIMDEVNEHFVTIISNEEVVRFSMFHMRNVSHKAIVGNQKQHEKEISSDQTNKNEKGKEEKTSNDEKVNIEEKVNKDVKINHEEIISKEEKPNHEEILGNEEKTNHEKKINKLRERLTRSINENE